MNNVATVSQGATSVTRAAGSDSSTKNDSDDFQTFLLLLTAQLKNQDPLKPVDSTEFVAQLATFSSVEQQVLSNKKLESILEALANGATGGLAQWIGQEVRNPGSASYENRPLEVQTFVHRDADDAQLVVYDETGKVVARQSVDMDAEYTNWSGILDDGTRAEAGDKFSFKIESLSDGEIILEASGLVYSKVAEVRLIEGQTILQFDDGTKMFAEDVTSLREATE
ncbi:MAG: flagellin biosynthesis protein FlgD [Rhodobacteraceae bacterium]|nr:flagellin biosynthesis protein FlgD [Paracoccaceae bacterium]